MLVRGREEEFFFDPEGFNEEHHVTSHNDRWFGINFLIRWIGLRQCKRSLSLSLSPTHQPHKIYDHRTNRLSSLPPHTTFSLTRLSLQASRTCASHLAELPPPRAWHPPQMINSNSSEAFPVIVNHAIDDFAVLSVNQLKHKKTYRKQTRNVIIHNNASLQTYIT